MIQTVRVDIRLISSANISEHWTAKSRRVIGQKRSVCYCLRVIDPKPSFPVTVTLTRIAPRLLDYDNLVASFKHVRDEVCDYLLPGMAPGRADACKEIAIQYDQRTGPKKTYYIEIQFEFEEKIENTLTQMDLFGKCS